MANETKRNTRRKKEKNKSKRWYQQPNKYTIIADGSDKDEASFPWQFTILKSDQGDH